MIGQHYNISGTINIWSIIGNYTWIYYNLHGNFIPTLFFGKKFYISKNILYPGMKFSKLVTNIGIHFHYIVFFNKSKWYICSKVLPTAQGVQGGNTPKCYIITMSICPLKDQPRKETKTDPYKATGVSTRRCKNRLKPPVLISAIKKNSTWLFQGEDM